MSGLRERDDGLLLLLQAAKKLDEDGYSRSPTGTCDRRPHSRSSYDHKYSSPSSSSCNQPKKPVGGTRCTHNELEKSRRAHLRACMENLKEQLHFDNDIPRVTMLTVLKKATSTILYLRQKNLCLETCEDNEKQRCVQLLKRRQFLKRKLEEKRNQSLKLQSWRERNRNCSECSITTNSSDDSELEPHARNSGRTTLTASFGSSVENNSACVSSYSFYGDNSATGSICSLNNGFMCKREIRPPSGLDVYDASSSDSGFEEITICRNGVPLHDEATTVYCVARGS